MKITYDQAGLQKIRRRSVLILLDMLGSLIVSASLISGEKNQLVGIMVRTSIFHTQHKNTAMYKPSVLHSPQVSKTSGVASMLLNWVQMLWRHPTIRGYHIPYSFRKGIK